MLNDLNGVHVALVYMLAIIASATVNYLVFELLRQARVIYEKEMDAIYAGNAEEVAHRDQPELTENVKSNRTIAKRKAQARKNIYEATKLGIVESILYAIVVILGEYNIIMGWLVLKAIIKFDKRQTTDYHGFLFGNALSLILSVLTVKSVVSLISGIS